MSADGPMVSVVVADRMVALARREALWRGILLGALATIAAVLLLAPALARAQSVPREAYELRRDIIRNGRYVWGVDAPTSAFAAQIHQESRYRLDAVSPVGAQGIAQFMPSTRRWIIAQYPAELGGDPATSEWGIRALVRYDRHLYDRLSGVDLCERFAFALSAYNGGWGWAIKRKQRSQSPEVCMFATCDINPGITASNQHENMMYPRRILLTLEPIYVVAGFGPGACTR